MKRAPSFVAVASLVVATSACKQKPELSGTFNGSGVVIYELYDPHPPRAEEPLPEVVVHEVTIATHGDDLEVTFGPCKVLVKKPRNRMDSKWKLAAPTPCKTREGPAKIAEGQLVEMSVEGDARAWFLLGFKGALDDDKFKVSWSFTSSP